MSTHIEVSPNGVGFIRVRTRKSIPGEPAAAKTARLQSWLSGSNSPRPNAAPTGCGDAPKSK
jgi:hypothetical protein